MIFWQIIIFKNLNYNYFSKGLTNLCKANFHALCAISNTANKKPHEFWVCAAILFVKRVLKPWFFLMKRTSLKLSVLKMIPQANFKIIISNSFLSTEPLWKSLSQTKANLHSKTLLSMCLKSLNNNNFKKTKTLSNWSV